MKHSTIIFFLAFLTACGGRYGRGLPKNIQESQLWANAIAETSADCPEMNLLNPVVGRFNYHMQYIPYPGAETISSKGACTFRVAHKNRWLIGNWNPESAQGAPTHTILIGFSDDRSRYLMGVLGANPTSVGGEGVQDLRSTSTVAIDFEMSMPSPADPSERTLFRRRLEVLDAKTIEVTDYRSGWNGTLEPFQIIKMSRIPN